MIIDSSGWTALQIIQWPLPGGFVVTSLSVFSYKNAYGFTLAVLRG